MFYHKNILACAEQLRRKLNKPYHFKEKRKKAKGDDEEECVLVCDLNLNSFGHYLRVLLSGFCL